MTQKETIALLLEWKRRLKVSQGTHYETTQQIALINNLIGIPSAVLSAIVGTSILATVQENVSINLKIAAGLISMLAAVLTGLHSLLRLEERAEKHRLSGAHYGALIRAIDEVLAFSEKGKDIPYESVKVIRERYDKISLEAPPTSRKVYEKVLGTMKSQNEKLQEHKKSEN